MVFTNYYTPIWFTPESERGSLRPASFLLSPIPYRYYHLFSTAYQLKDHPNKYKLFPSEVLLDYSVQDARNVEGYSKGVPLSDTLPECIITELIDEIYKLFFVTDKDREEINYLTAFLVDEHFQDPSWNCVECKKRGLYKQRNCPFFTKEEEEKYFDPAFYFAIDGQRTSKCPVGAIDREKVDALTEAVNLFNKGILPERGGMGDQTIFFGYTSQAASAKIDQHNNKSKEEQ